MSLSITFLPCENAIWGLQSKRIRWQQGEICDLLFVHHYECVHPNVWWPKTLSWTQINLCHSLSLNSLWQPIRSWQRHFTPLERNQLRKNMEIDTYNDSQHSHHHLSLLCSLLHWCTFLKNIFFSSTQMTSLRKLSINYFNRISLPLFS